ncbi:NCS2 family permease [Enemella sp. A6]|uniref:NCS2 family permease n=1 Tax=Enemella sp. A6 TaxID=3440152 RepID=UPI003EBC0115
MSTVDTENSATGRLDRWFEITKRGSNTGREVRGGLVTFLAMAYIIALNPLIIGTAPDKDGNLISGQPYLDAAGEVIGANVGASIAMVAAATALIAGVMTMLMGVVGRYPLGIAAGLGLNALLAYVIAPQMTWPQAMGLVVWEGIIIALLVLTGFRTAVFRAVPATLRTAIAVGIGLFITFVGLINAGIVRKPQGAVPVEFGINGSLIGWPMTVFVIGLLLVTVLYARKVKGALLISVIVATALAAIIEAVSKIGPMAPDGSNPTGWSLNVPATDSVISLPDFGLLGRVDMFGAFSQENVTTIGIAMLIFALLLADFFDTMGTVVAVGAEGNLLDEKGHPPHLGAILMVDSLSAAAGGLGSVSSNTAYVESASGVAAGARTGIASVVTGVGFLLAIFFSPLINIVPSEAVAPVLVFVGFLMMSQVTSINWDDMEEALPAFLTIVMMPFAYSITVGIGAGFILYVVLKAVRGKAAKVHPLMYVVALLFIFYFVQGVFSPLLS